LAIDTRRAIDRAALARAVQRQSLAPAAPWLHGEAARRMAERLPVVRCKPTVVIDWWSHAGASRDLLGAVYPQARVLRVEPAAAIARPVLPWWQAVLRRRALSIEASDLQPAAAQLVWANMMLHAFDDPGALLRQWHAALAIDGFLMFSTLGPGTLKTLREVYRDAGWGAAHAPFVDMHDLGDMLVGTGFAEPVMDQEALRLTWAAPAALLAELRGLGINADPSRHAGLRTPRWRTRLESALAERAGADGRIALEFELVYGHAFKPPPRLRVTGQTQVSVDELQRMARAGRRDRGLG
jgi:malonyl-CoA O-methyltransferase